MGPARLDWNVGGREVAALCQALLLLLGHVAARRPGKLDGPRSVIVLPETLEHGLLVRGGRTEGRRGRKPLVVIVVGSGDGNGPLGTQDLTGEMARGGRLKRWLWRRVGRLIPNSRACEGMRGGLGLQIDGEGVVTLVARTRRTGLVGCIARHPRVGGGRPLQLLPLGRGRARTKVGL